MQRRILVVDDNQDSASTMAILLRLMGNVTQTANDGLQAVEAASDFRPDVVLLDIGLPQIDGYEACRRIRQQPGGSDVVMVAVTGWGQDEDRMRSSEAGFDHHLVKPVDQATLEDILASVTSS